jgi:hypothetical protein
VDKAHLKIRNIHGAAGFRATLAQDCLKLRFHVKHCGMVRPVTSAAAPCLPLGTVTARAPPLRRQHHDSALWLLTLGLTVQAGGGHRIVHNLPLEWGHRLQPHRRTR